MAEKKKAESWLALKSVLWKEAETWVEWLVVRMALVWGLWMAEMKDELL